LLYHSMDYFAVYIVYVVLKCIRGIRSSFNACDAGFSYYRIWVDTTIVCPVDEV
jgi:hypothetical protein